MDRTRVVVYGSLKAGHGNHLCLEAEDTVYLGRMTFPGKMYSLSWFPAVVEGAGTVLGEVYEISTETLMGLDVLEGHPNFYERKKIETPWKNAWCYFMTEEGVGNAPEVEDGIWMPTQEEKDWYDMQNQA